MEIPNPAVTNLRLNPNFSELCSIQESPRLKNTSESIHTSPRWSSALTNHLMRSVNGFATWISVASTQPVFNLCLRSQNGFDYLLTYSDNPQTVFPRYCVSWMVSSGEFWSGWYGLIVNSPVVMAEWWFLVYFSGECCGVKASSLARYAWFSGEAP